MRKILLASMALVVCVSASAQKVYREYGPIVKDRQNVTSEKEVANNNFVPYRHNFKGNNPLARISGVDTVRLGDQANTFGPAFGVTEGIASNPAINTVVMVHRANPGFPAGATGSGFFVYDYSTDGGQTWSKNNGPIYAPGTGKANGRYPRAVIYNPTGNTTATNAYVSCAGPSLPGLNGSWGGVAIGSSRIGQQTTVDGELQADSINQFSLPDNYSINSAGVSFILNTNDPGLAGWTNELFIHRGIWNTTTNSFDYTPIRLAYPSWAPQPSAQQLVWGSGNIGYHVALSRVDTVLAPTPHLQICIAKTTDNGLTWSAPMQLDLAGATLNTAITNPCTAFEFDAAVDKNNDLHIITTIHEAGANDYSVATGDSVMAVYHLMTDGGNSVPKRLAFITFNQQFRGTFTNGGLSIDQRPGMAVSSSRDKVFMTWFDTDSNLFQTENLLPDMYATGFDVDTKAYTSSLNAGVTGMVTNFTELVNTGLPSTPFASTGNFAMNVNGKYEIPVTFVQLDSAQNAAGPSFFYYIKGAAFAPTDFNFYPVSVEEIDTYNFAVSQNRPNPFTGATQIDVLLNDASNVNLNIVNVLGQPVYTSNSKMTAGTHTMTIAADKLEAGVYFYTVTVGNKSITKRMMVE